MELKQLQIRKTKLERQLSTARAEKQDACNLFEKIKNQINNIEQEIKGLKLKDLIVSEHALIRYLERVNGIDMEEIREKILSPLVRAAMSQGDGKVKGNYTVVFQNRVVVTIT